MSSPPPPPPLPSIFREPLHSPYQSLISLFLLTRLTFFSIAFLTPSPAYDSSTNLILPTQAHDDHSGILWHLLTKLVERLTRWDAIYFVKVAERGYVREQEWAFGWGMTRVMGVVGRVVIQLLPVDIPNPYPFAFAGILIANTMHLLSVLVLYKLTKLVYNHTPDGKRISFLSTALHVITPAGIFLSAPYSESLFALLSFSGYYLYVGSVHAYYSRNGLGQMAMLLATGCVWMLAGMVRSNGVLNGVVVLGDFLTTGWGIIIRRKSENAEDIGLGQRLSRLVGLGVAGVMVGLGLAVPQGIAYMQFCEGEGRKQREWCVRRVPSIYLYVQDKYWNVGFLRYWTPGNIPLFLLAAPMLYILIRSAWYTLTETPTITSYPPALKRLSSKKVPSSAGPTTNEINTSLIRSFALPQLALAIMALTSYHVQIINRLSSGCVVWYWWLAQAILYGEEDSERKRVARWAVRWCVGYALVQGVLFAGFLPPA